MSLIIKITLYSDDDTVKILPTDEDMDWFARKRLAAKDSAGKLTYTEWAFLINETVPLIHFIFHVRRKIKVLILE